MNQRVLIDWALIALAIGAATAAAVPIDGVRPFLVLAAALIVPGAAALTLLDVDELLPAAALAVTLSIAIDVIGALILAWTELWHPAAFAIALGAASIGLLLSDVRHSSAAREVTSSRA